MESLRQSVHDYVQRHDDLGSFDVESASPLLESPVHRGLGRFIACPEDELGSLLDDLLTPGVLFGGDLDDVVLICLDEEGDPPFAIHGHPEAMAELVDEIPGLRFLITSTSASWRVVRRDASHLRIEGGVWTKFFPWPHVRRSFVFGGIVTGIAFLVVWGVHSGFLSAQTPGVISVSGSASVLGYLFVALGPGAVTAGLDFSELCGLGPDESRAPVRWFCLVILVAVALFFAVVLGTLHSPAAFSSGH